MAIPRASCRQDETLPVRRNTLLSLDLRLHVVDRVRGPERDLPGGQHRDEDLDTGTDPLHELQDRLLLDVVVGESTAVPQLLDGEDEMLLVERDTLAALYLDL